MIEIRHILMVVGDQNKVEDHNLELPGTVGYQLDPNDGWPVDLTLAMYRAAALTFQAMSGLAPQLLGGRSASYEGVLEIERKLLDVERRSPDRFQLVLSVDGLSIRPKLNLDQRATALCCFIWNRLMVSRIRVHRTFIFSREREGVSESERSRHLQALNSLCRRHLLTSRLLPFTIIMHPYMIYTFVNTAVSCALTMIACPGILDASFFLSELRKIIDIVVASQKTIGSSLGQKAVMLLEALLIRAKDLKHGSERPTKRRTDSNSPTASSPAHSDDDALKRKNTRLGSYQVAPANSRGQFHDTIYSESRPIVAISRSTPPGHTQPHLEKHNHPVNCDQSGPSITAQKEAPSPGSSTCNLSLPSSSQYPPSQDFAETLRVCVHLPIAATTFYNFY